MTRNADVGLVDSQQRQLSCEQMKREMAALALLQPKLFQHMLW